MAAGPRPKAPEVRKRKNVRSTAVDVYSDKPVKPPSLPQYRPGKKKWPAVTKKWWAMWKAEPVSALFNATDWDYLLDTAVLHAAYWADGELRHGVELRRRTENFGATISDRHRLQINTVKSAKEATSVTADKQASQPLQSKDMFDNVISIARE